MSVSNHLSIAIITHTSLLFLIGILFQLTHTHILAIELCPPGDMNKQRARRRLVRTHISNFPEASRKIRHSRPRNKSENGRALFVASSTMTCVYWAIFDVGHTISMLCVCVSVPSAEESESRAKSARKICL